MIKMRAVFSRAKDEIRTRDPNLGKVVLYQLSYFRLFCGTKIEFNLIPVKSKINIFLF